jgi:hypothetical protein
LIASGGSFAAMGDTQRVDNWGIRQTVFKVLSLKINILHDLNGAQERQSNILDNRLIIDTYGMPLNQEWS